MIIRKEYMFHNFPIYSSLAGLPLAGKPIKLGRRTHVNRPPTLSRHELRRLVAEMVD